MSTTLIDLRSDTVTRPSPAMRRAMAEAEVGDDVLDGDPTTRRLERRVAELLGKEAALFLPSGTQGNQVAIHVLAPRGTEASCLMPSNACKASDGRSQNIRSGRISHWKQLCVAFSMKLGDTATAAPVQ